MNLGVPKIIKKTEPNVPKLKACQRADVNNKPINQNKTLQSPK